MQEDDHLANLCRYVERNPVRAGLAASCVDWAWSSAGQAKLGPALSIPLEDLPIKRRSDWVQWVDRPQTAAEEAALLKCIRENRPYGSDEWLAKMKKDLGWREPLPRGRPWPKGKKAGKT